MAQYQVTGVWWPDGWEPCGPLDVPNCIGLASQQGVSRPAMSMKRALATVRGLNRQNMDHPGSVWYVVTEVDDEPAPGGQLRPERVLRPVAVGGKGDCSHCPAHAFPCAAEKS